MASNEPTIKEHLCHFYHLSPEEKNDWLKGKAKDFLDFTKAAVTALALYASSLSVYELTKNSESWLGGATSIALLVATWFVYGAATIWWALTWNYERTRRVAGAICVVVLALAVIGAGAVQSAH